MSSAAIAKSVNHTTVNDSSGFPGGAQEIRRWSIMIVINFMLQYVAYCITTLNILVCCLTHYTSEYYGNLSLCSWYILV